TALIPWDVLGGALHKHWLVKISEQRFISLSTWHHAITDGTSEFVRAKQTIAAYFGKETLPQSVEAYGQQIARRRITSDTLSMNQFWHSQLGNVESLGYRSKNPGDLQISQTLLMGDKKAAIENWCKEKGVSFVNLLRTLFALSVRNCFYQADDVALIEAVAARNTDERDSTGCYFQFAPSLFLGEDCDKNGSIVELLNAHRAWRKQLNDNVHLSFSARGKVLSPEGLEFQFNYRPPEASQGFDAEGQLCFLKAIQPDNPGMVKLLISPEPNSVALRLSYFDKEFDGFNICERIVSVIDQIVAGTDQLSELDWLIGNERSAQLLQATQLSQLSPLPQSDEEVGRSSDTVITLIEQSIQRAPEAIAVKCGTESLTYAELGEKSNRVARLLAEKGVSTGDRVAICVERSIELPVFVIATLKLGAAYVPMDPAYPADRLSYIAKDSGVALIVTEASVIDKLTGDNVLPESIGVLLRADAVDESEGLDSSSLDALSIGRVVNADDPIYVIYTSGSTGLPKGAELCHKGEVNLLNWYTESLALSAADNVLMISAIGFDLTQKNLFASFVSGGTLVLPSMEEYDPEVIAQLIQDNEITVVNCAPSAFYPVAALSQHVGYPYSSLRHLVLGGEPIRTESLSGWLSEPNCNCVLTNSYGPTECTDVVAYHQFNDGIVDGQTLPIGKAIQNTQLYVVNRRGGLMPTGAAGELCVAGIGVGKGYLNQPELTADVFAANPFAEDESQWYHTGDLVQYDTSGSLVYVGRKDFQVKLRGLRIEPGEIDTLVKAQAGVEDSLTLVRDDLLVSYITYATTSKAVSTSDIKAALKTQLPDFMVPSAIMVLPVWPLTPNGKIDRKALPQPDLSGDEGDFVSPRNDTEQQIADIWCQVLGLSKVGITADFFSVGGHSLLATQVVARIRQTFGIELSVRALFENSTIETLVVAIEVAAASGQIITAPPI
ncbi:MAG: amino acid adenylation domain-containing protein, partial [Pseudomonadales bacterium]|nr:amino acid adenylation domain-containing protein [Pseudomonadales bacterium]